MRLKSNQLSDSLKQLAPVYFISGDEPLQLGEAADDIRAAAKRLGFSTREVLTIDSGEEWKQLALAASEMSIFADKKLLDLRLPSGKPGTDGSKALLSYCQKPPPDTLLLITAGKIETASQKTQWFQALDKIGVIVQVWPLTGGELQQWLEQRAAKRSLRLAPDAVKLLAARIEGNLLAAAQEIEKLYILYGQAQVSLAMLEQAVADSSRFDVFKLTDSVLAGKMNRSLRILNALRLEGIAAPVILWALAREARTLFHLKTELQHGTPQEAAFKKYQIWDSRKQTVAPALQRLNLSDLRRILTLSATCDQQIKGQLSGDYWESLLAICELFAKKA